MSPLPPSAATPPGSGPFCRKTGQNLTSFRGSGRFFQLSAAVRAISRDITPGQKLPHCRRSALQPTKPPRTSRAIEVLLSVRVSCAKGPEAYGAKLVSQRAARSARLDRAARAGASSANAKSHLRSRECRAFANMQNGPVRGGVLRTGPEGGRGKSATAASSDSAAPPSHRPCRRHQGNLRWGSRALHPSRTWNTAYASRNRSPWPPFSWCLP